jgi:tRNA(Ile)-lysidine synthase
VAPRAPFTVTPSTDSSADHLVLEAVGVALRALPHDARIAIAFSGGLDSTVLLEATMRVAGASRCYALHVHHGLSPNADRWLAQGEAFAHALGVGFASRHVDVPKSAGVSIEAAARDARYRALDALCVEHQVQQLWLAQHADDQAETVLLQLLRGAGLAGLAAMAHEYRPPGAAAVRVRPLLHLLRAQLEAYARARGLRWIDDESNADTRYARNALRHEVLPPLAVHFPGFGFARGRAAALGAPPQRLVDDLARIDMQSAASEDGRSLDRAALLTLDDDRAQNLLRYWMRTLGLPAASTARLTDALRQLREVGDDHGLRVDHAGQALRSYRGQIYWEVGDSADAADEAALAAREVSNLSWRGEAVWRLPQWRGTFVFADADEDDADAVPATLLMRLPLHARSRSGGERMRCDAHGPNRTLKNLFQERGVPSWKRDVPLLFASEQLLFVPLLGVNRAALEALSTPDDAPPSDRASTDRSVSPDAAGAPRARCIRIDWREDLLLA